MDYDHTDILHNGGLEGLEDYKVFRRRYPSRSSLPVRLITDWHIQEIPMSGKRFARWICLVGVYKDALIRTSPITSIIAPRKVCTCNCIYTLGPSTKVLLNPLLGIERSFVDGFPDNWESIVDKAFADAAGAATEVPAVEMTSHGVEQDVAEAADADVEEAVGGNEAVVMLESQADERQRGKRDSRAEREPAPAVLFGSVDISGVFAHPVVTARVDESREEVLHQHDESTVSLSGELISNDLQAGKLPDPNVSVELGDDSHPCRNSINLDIRNESVSEIQQDLMNDNISDDGRISEEQTIREINNILNSTAGTLSPSVDDVFDDYDKSLLAVEEHKQPARRVSSTPKKCDYPTVEEFVQRTSPFKLPPRPPVRLSTSTAQKNNSICLGDQLMDVRPIRPVSNQSAVDVSAPTNTAPLDVPGTRYQGVPTGTKQTVSRSYIADESFDTQDALDDVDERQTVDTAECVGTAQTVGTAECVDTQEAFEIINTQEAHIEEPVTHDTPSNIRNVNSTAEDIPQSPLNDVPVADLLPPAAVSPSKRPRLSLEGRESGNSSFRQEVDKDKFSDQYFERIKMAYSDQLMSSPMKPLHSSPDSTLRPAVQHSPAVESRPSVTSRSDQSMIEEATAANRSVKQFRKPSIRISLKPRSESNSLSRLDELKEVVSLAETLDSVENGLECQMDGGLKTVSLVEDDVESETSSTKIVRRSSTGTRRPADTTIANDTVISETAMVRTETSKVSKLPVKMISSLESGASGCDLSVGKSFAAKAKKKKTLLVMPKKLKSLSKPKRK